MSDVLSESRCRQVIALGRLGWSLHRIERVAGVTFGVGWVLGIRAMPAIVHRQHRDHLGARGYSFAPQSPTAGQERVHAGHAASPTVIHPTAASDAGLTRRDTVIGTTIPSRQTHVSRSPR